MNGKLILLLLIRILSLYGTQMYVLYVQYVQHTTTTTIYKFNIIYRNFIFGTNKIKYTNSYTHTRKLIFFLLNTFILNFLVPVDSSPQSTDKFSTL